MGPDLNRIMAQAGAAVDQFFTRLAELPKPTKDIIALALVLVGALFCFLGFRFFKYVLGLCGFLIGGVTGLATYYLIPVVRDWGEIGQYVVAAVFGAVGAALFFLLFYYFGVFIFGAVATMWLALVFLPDVVGQYRALVVLGIGFVGGILGLLLRRQLVIVFTAALGSIAMLAGIGYFYGWPLGMTSYKMEGFLTGSFIQSVVQHQDGPLCLVILGLAFLGGLIVQGLTAPKKVQQDND